MIQNRAILDFYSVSRRKKMGFAGNEKILAGRCRLDIPAGFLTAVL